MSEFRHISIPVKDITLEMCLATPCKKEARERIRQCFRKGIFTEFETRMAIEEYGLEEDA